MVEKHRKLSEELKDKRVKCLTMKDSHPVPSGTLGTITHVDDVGTIHVQWDNGSTLGLVPDEDTYQFVKE